MTSATSAVDRMRRVGGRRTISPGAMAFSGTSSRYRIASTALIVSAGLDRSIWIWFASPPCKWRGQRRSEGGTWSNSFSQIFKQRRLVPSNEARNKNSSARCSYLVQSPTALHFGSACWPRSADYFDQFRSACKWLPLTGQRSAVGRIPSSTDTKLWFS